MSSSAFTRFAASLSVANRLLVANDGNNQTLGRVDFYHAAWAAYVAAWDSYIKSACQEYISKSNVSLALGISNTGVVAYQAVHDIASDLFQFRLEKFNTPNFDNSREFLIGSSGYDPYADWRWDKKALTNLRVKELLNEAVRVRHAFAHGFPVRNIRHLVFIDGTNSITYRKAVFVRSMLAHLVLTTDKALDDRLNTLFRRHF